MSDPAPACSCRLPWIVAIIALGIVVADGVVMRMAARPTVGGDTPPAAVAMPPTDPRLTTLQHDLNEARRVLDDAQSALGQRDREIATANEELHALRRELEALRARDAAPAR